jgi:hypothetical protein
MSLLDISVLTTLDNIIEKYLLKDYMLIRYWTSLSLSKFDVVHCNSHLILPERVHLRNLVEHLNEIRKLDFWSPEE